MADHLMSSLLMSIWKLSNVSKKTCKWPMTEDGHQLPV